jgi:hypothetical protein
MQPTSGGAAPRAGGTITGLPAVAGEQAAVGQVIATIEASLPQAPPEDGEVTGRAH